jgi:hypothetical protein
MLAFHTPFDGNKSDPFRPLFKKTKLLKGSLESTVRYDSISVEVQ